MFSDSVYLVLYFSVMAILSVFGIHRYLMVYLYHRHKDDTPQPLRVYEEEELPRVTLQLPVFEEMYVVERLIETVCRLDYPRDRMQIQVLDDSRDETIEIARAKVEEYKARGFDIDYIHRTDRHGFKAGALEAAMPFATGELIAILDADFVPGPEFLRETIHYFTDPEVAVVQTRWGHINQDFSLLTELQSIFLDGHLVIEQTARNRSGRFFNFNGTGGVWRKEAIIEAGGWQHETLTEDMDLSFRSQMLGRKFVFLKDAVTPAELPADMNAFKSQQHRWTKGTVQVARKLLLPIWRSDSPLKCKVEASWQLTMGSCYLLMIAMVLLVLPIVQIRFHQRWWETLFIDFPLFMAATTSIFSFYYFSQKEAYANYRERIKYLPVLIALGIGMAVSNSKAVLEGLFGHESEFVRTPKHLLEGRSGDWKSKKYKGIKNILLPIIELSLGCYCLVSMHAAVTAGRLLSLPFLTLFVFGFFYVGTCSLFQGLGAKAPAAQPAPQPVVGPEPQLELEPVEVGQVA